MVLRRHPDNRADLKHPQLAIIVEVIRNMCCLSVLPDYFELRKYNLLELCAPEGGIKVVGEKRERVARGEVEGDTKTVGEKSVEIGTVAKEDVETDSDDRKGDNNETVGSELKDEAVESKGRDDVDDQKEKPMQTGERGDKSKDANIEEQAGERGDKNKGVNTEEEVGETGKKVMYQ
jgi:tRNA acetyltransferase TAN1